MPSWETDSIELKETKFEFSDNGSQIEDKAVPEAWKNTALSPNVKKWSADELEKYLDSKISFVEAKGTRYHNYS